MFLTAKTVKRDWCVNFDLSFVSEMSVSLLLVKLVVCKVQVVVGNG